MKVVYTGCVANRRALSTIGRLALTGTSGVNADSREVASGSDDFATGQRGR